MPETSTPLALLDHRFVLVTGKGGVGKSTVTAVLAALSAAAGRRTLVCELNAHERIPPLFGHEPVGEQVTAIAENLWAVNIRPAAALEEYALMKLRFRTLYKLVFENPLVQRFVQFVPGMNDLLMLGKAFNHERERDESGQPAWDCILVDAPATGHGLTFFRLPKVIMEAVPFGNMHDESAEMWGLLQDRSRTVVHLVTLPEELPVQETRELYAQLAGVLGLPVGHLFLNMVPPPLLDPAQRAELGRVLPARPTDPALGVLWETTRIRLGREALAAGHAAHLADLGLPILPLPLLYTRGFGPAEIASLADVVRAGGRP